VQRKRYISMVEKLLQECRRSAFVSMANKKRILRSAEREQYL
jgi:hypothetical protein